MAAEYESVVCVKNEVFVFRIPPRPSNRGYRASDWKLDTPDWTGRLRVIAKGKNILLRLEDKVSGEEFAKCPVDSYPGVAVEPVMDSSRYFVIRIQEGERSAFIGIGFTDRSDSFDLNVSLQDHFKWLKQEAELEKSSKNFDQGPKLDLSLKEGQTMKLNIVGQSATKSRPKPHAGSGAGGLLPPPPGPGIKILPPPGSGPNVGIQHSANQDASSSSASHPLLDLLSMNPSADASGIGAAPGSKANPIPSSELALKGTNEDSKSAAASNSDSSGWGDFTSSHSSASNWVQF